MVRWRLGFFRREVALWWLSLHVTRFTTKIYTLSLHDALPIFPRRARRRRRLPWRPAALLLQRRSQARGRLLGGDARPDRVKDRKSTRLNSSHSQISYAVLCLK